MREDTCLLRHPEQGRSTSNEGEEAVHAPGRMVHAGGSALRASSDAGSDGRAEDSARGELSSATTEHSGGYEIEQHE